jgi:NitT/TauT family transport system substrate-binding protein
MATRWRGALMAGLAAGWLLAACAAGGGAPPPAPTSAGGAVTAPVTAAAGVAPAPIPLRVNYSTRGGGQAHLWMAYEGGYLQAQGLAAELTNVSPTSRVIPAMVAGEVHLSGMDPGATILTSLEGLDMVLLATGTNRTNLAIIAQPSIRQPQDLRGKALGITRIGSSTHIAALLALDLWGLEPDRDVALRQIGEATALPAALEARQIDAAIVGIPSNTLLRRAGYPELLNLAEYGPEYLGSVVAALRPWVAANDEAVLRFARAYVQGRQRLLSDKPWALGVLREYLQLDDPEALDEVYTQIASCCAAVPYISESGAARLIADLARDEPRLAGRQPGEWIDARYLQAAEATTAGGAPAR